MESRIISEKNNQSDTLNRLKKQINDIKMESAELKDKLEFQELVLNSSLNSTVITDFKGNIVWVNDAFCKLTGYTKHEIINKNPRVLKSGIHNTAFYKKLWSTITQGQVWKGEITNRKKNGQLYHERIEISPVINRNEEITHFIGIKQDITNQKLTNDALSESYLKYEELAYIFNQSPAIGFSWLENEKRTVEFVTDNIKQWGYIPEDFYSQNLTFPDIIYNEDKSLILSDLKEKIDRGFDRIKQHFRIITKTGEVKWVDSHLYFRLGEYDKVTHLQGVLLDVTERKNAEEDSKYQLEQLMQADKMIALGTLVSGVAHEINNPNNFVILNLPIIEKVWFKIQPILDEYYEKNGDFSVGDKLKYSKIKNSMPLLLGGINDGSQRIKNIVEDLKSFARKEKPNYDQKIDLNKVVQTSINLTSNLLSKSTDKFYVKYFNGPLYAKGNKQKLEQVVINLIENSCQSLENRKQAIKVELTKNNDNVCIIVIDEGSGMDDNNLRKITDPFFTTKRNKGGTGLGLSIANKILLEHNGQLKFESEKGKGTTSIIKLPILEGI